MTVNQRREAAIILRRHPARPFDRSRKNRQKVRQSRTHRRFRDRQLLAGYGFQARGEFKAEKSTNAKPTAL